MSDAIGRDSVGPVPSPDSEAAGLRHAGSGDPAYNATHVNDVGRVPSHGAVVGRLPSAGADAVFVPPHGDSSPPHGTFIPAPSEPLPRRLRRLHRVWPDHDGNISYLLTLCVADRTPVLNNELTFEHLVAFLLDSPTRYNWFGRRFVVMPDHVHLIARMGQNAVRLGQWIKALKAVVGGLERREERPVGAPGLPAVASSADVGRVPQHGVPAVGRAPSHGVPAVGRVPSHGVPVPSQDVGRVPPRGDHEFTRIQRPWRWQAGYHDHKFRTPESESRKWEYVCLNPVRYGLVKRPEEWPYGGEMFYNAADGPRLVRGTPPLLETGMLIEEAPVGISRPGN